LMEARAGTGSNSGVPAFVFTAEESVERWIGVAVKGLLLVGIRVELRRETVRHKRLRIVFFEKAK
jgi:hypothetical protein